MNRNEKPNYIFYLQVLSVILIWIFVSAITWWILRLLWLAWRLHDAPDASVGISIVVIPVFLVLAGVLTYVFVGIQRDSDGGPAADGLADQVRGGPGGGPEPGEVR